MVAESYVRKSITVKHESTSETFPLTVIGTLLLTLRGQLCGPEYAKANPSLLLPIDKRPPRHSLALRAL
jgi:hypothetical protein